MGSLAKPVIISGAGVVGLTLAHGLKKANIPFEVYERDDHIDARSQGWGITIHWALPFLVELLDHATVDAVENVQVDPEVGRNDRGNFLFLNLETLHPKFRIPPNRRRRVNRDKLRKALLQGVADHVRWGKRLNNIELTEGENRGVRAHFADGSSVEGSMVIGAEGTNSRTRKFLVPDNYRNHQLPVRFIGAAVDMTPEQVRPLRDIDPLLFQGCHPVTGHYLWVSIMESPEANGTKGTDEERYRVQIVTSWMVKSEKDEVPPSDAERIAEMKRRATDFHPLLRQAVQSIPESAQALEIALQDWPCFDWDNRDGRVTLVGDAAHAMTMYRGEAANHGMLDAYNLVQCLKKIVSNETSRKAAIDHYEEEMRARTGGEEGAVMLSRQACLDAHDFHGLSEKSAVLRRRAIQTE
ncbi:Aromatic-ring hydroxylase-like protein [Metarhizium album ARSEF 1941]|uniref:Aromatic-ring hydroxylase-like protein n=1 Tax=Metarhizium album (strain ARSEF 1941) TaxID=1081103 RepID=A0A0B2X9T6_METAS|nr:Aromatic-ring hydroxylase-like protein [Metarhizium album ARSEF 1941]KHO02086.1 Aromatic-ring hydroxylase-like protein [Metarhizium album ARSEF 1941]